MCIAGHTSKVADSTLAYEKAREQVAQFIGAESASNIVFTSGATSAMNLVAHSFGANLKAGDEIIVSELEHHSNLVPVATFGGTQCGGGQANQLALLAYHRRSDLAP